MLLTTSKKPPVLPKLQPVHLLRFTYVFIYVRRLHQPPPAFGCASTQTKTRPTARAPQQVTSPTISDFLCASTFQESYIPRFIFQPVFVTRRHVLEGTKQGLKNNLHPHPIPTMASASPESRTRASIRLGLDPCGTSAVQQPPANPLFAKALATSKSRL